MKNIILAEDDEAIIEVITLILQEEGYSVTAVRTEQQLNNVLSYLTPDLLLLDIGIPGNNGGVIAKTLKQDKNVSFPIIILSANSEIESIAKDSGANDFLIKPFSIEDLLAIIQRYLPRRDK